MHNNDDSTQLPEEQLPLPVKVASLYRFAAQAMQYPSVEWLNNDFIATLYQLLASLGEDDLSGELQEQFTSSADYINDLKVEHTRLFINAVPHLLAPPYASVYVDRSLNGPFVSELMRFYRQAGLWVKTPGDLPDHLCSMLECLACLIEDGDMLAEQQFLAKLWLPWFPQFVERVEAGANHPYYPIIVRLIDYLTKEDDA